MMGEYEDVLGATEVVVGLEARISALRAGRTPAAEARAVLTPPLRDRRDHVAGPGSAAVEIVIFGAYGAPVSRALGRLVGRLRDAHPGALRVAWRHFPDPDADHRSTALALAAEAAASESRFWPMNRELLALRHFDLVGVQHAALRADVDFDRLLWLVRGGVGADRIVGDVASGLASSVVDAPALFVNGERFDGELDADAVWAAGQREVPA